MTAWVLVGLPGAAVDTRLRRGELEARSDSVSNVTGIRGLLHMNVPTGLHNILSEGKISFSIDRLEKRTLCFFDTLYI